MYGLVIASHGNLATELVATAEQIVGPLSHTATCGVAPGTSLQEIRAKILEAVKQVDVGDGVMVLTDLIGGSACTQSLSLCQELQIEVLTGVNLPMILKANTLREAPQTLNQLAHTLADYGKRNITCATDNLRIESPVAAGRT